MSSIDTDPAHRALKVEAAFCTHRGDRPVNEDYAGIYDGAPERGAVPGFIAAIADGMGGAKGGRVAAELAVRGFIDGCLGQSETLGFARIGARALESINRWIHVIGCTDPQLNGMACTLTALFLCGRQLHVIHVGDSRLYRLREDRLVLMTVDHTLGRPGTSHALTRALGAQDSVRADYAVHSARTHDRYLLCSDGVHGSVSLRQLHDALSQRSAPAETARQLLSAAGEARAGDNATALVIDILGLPAASAADLHLTVAALALLPLPDTGAVIDSFELRSIVADSRYSRVFEAIDSDSGAAVIVKFPKPQPGIEAMLRHAFLRETWIAARVHSPFVAEVIELPTERRSGLYSVMPHYEGETLEQRLLRRPQLGLVAGIGIAMKLAKAVAALHRARIVHRDIKPENVVLERKGGLKLIDLGAARLPDVEDFSVADIPGTPSYMAPELLAGAVGDECSDIFALGVTIYRMFTAGAYPYGEIEPFSHPHFGSPSRLTKHRPDLPAWLDHAVARAIAIDANQRYADVMEFAFELEHGSLHAPSVHRSPLPLYARNPLRFWQVIAALLAVALLLVLRFK